MATIYLFYDFVQKYLKLSIFPKLVYLPKNHLIVQLTICSCPNFYPFRCCLNIMPEYRMRFRITKNIIKKPYLFTQMTNWDIKLNLNLAPFLLKLIRIIYQILFKFLLFFYPKQVQSLIKLYQSFLIIFHYQVYATFYLMQVP